MKPQSLSAIFDRKRLKAAVAMGFITQEQARACLQEQEQSQANTSLLEICKQKGYINDEQINKLMSCRPDEQIKNLMRRGRIQVQPLQSSTSAAAPDAAAPQAAVGVSADAEGQTAAEQSSDSFPTPDLPGSAQRIKVKLPAIQSLPKAPPRAVRRPLEHGGTHEETTSLHTLKIEEELRLQLEAKERLLQSERKRLEFLKKQNEELKQRAEKFYRELARKEEEKANLAQQINQHLAQQQELRNRLQEHQNKLDAAYQTIAEHEKLVKKHKDMELVWRNLWERGAEELTKAEKAKLDADEELQKQSLLWEEKLKKAQEQLAELEARLASQEEELRESQRQKELEAEKEKLLQEISKLEDKLALVEKQLRNEIEEREFAQDQLEMFKELHQEGIELSEQKVRELIEKFREEKSALENEFQQRLADMEKENIAQRKALEENFAAEKKQLEEEFLNQKNALEEQMLEERAQLEAKVMRHEQECQNLAAKLEQFQASVTEWDSLLEEEKQKIANLEQELAAERRLKENALKQQAETAQRLEELQEELERFRLVYVEGEFPPGTKLPGSHGEFYEITHTLGQGGMGITYAARRLSDDFVVAIKVIAKEILGNLKEVMRFVHEARTIIGFDHPNLIKGYDLHQDRELCYYTMEYLDGQSVEDMIVERGRIEQLEAAEIILQIARAFTYLQEHALIHRDVKPANIIVTSEGVAKLVDFGIVKMTDRICSLTTEAVILGTPYYLSPEQAMGDPLDFRSDIYNLGASFYHMVVGEVPFTGDNPIEVIKKRLSRPPKPGKVDSSLHPQLCSVIEKMMHKRPTKRYASCQDMQAALEQLVQTLRQESAKA